MIALQIFVYNAPMHMKSLLRYLLLAATFLHLGGLTLSVSADEISEPLPPQSMASATTSGSFFDRAGVAIDDTLGEALNLIGVPYKRGGKSPELGFDCSGFVSHVYEQSIGLVLPHNAKAMSREGENIDKNALQPGDLVFFNTMRRAFSHVGIYVGDGQFVHAPRKGGKVRVEDIDASYWKHRYNGARRVAK
jgi:cell wall-associated NlpC family hydrolase